LPEHADLLPFNPSFYLSYDLPLSGLNSVVFSPADMESSIFVFCFGVDNFLIRTAPDKTFDMIMDDFNYLVLILILVVGTVLVLFFRHQLNLAKLKKPHLE
jgi:ER membrane protein complex subunit 1